MLEGENYQMAAKTSDLLWVGVLGGRTFAALALFWFALGFIFKRRVWGFKV